MKKSVWLGMALVAFLSACAAPAVISDIGEDRVKVRGNAYTKPEDKLAKAQEACALYKRQAVAISEFCVDPYCAWKDTLYACKP